MGFGDKLTTCIWTIFGENLDNIWSIKRENMKLQYNMAEQEIVMKTTDEHID